MVVSLKSSSKIRKRKQAYIMVTSNYMLVRINATDDIKHKVVSVVFSSDGVSQIIDA